MRGLFLIMAVVTTFFTACASSQNSNTTLSTTNTNANSNTTNANSNTSLSIVPGAMARAPDEKEVWIGIIYRKEYGKDVYKIAGPVPDRICMQKRNGGNHDKIRWCVFFNCQLTDETPSAVDVIISDFREPGGQRDPLETGGGAHDFTISNVNPGDARCENAFRILKNTAAPGAYKYQITVKVGNKVVAEIDPQVVISANQ